VGKGRGQLIIPRKVEEEKKKSNSPTIERGSRTGSQMSGETIVEAVNEKRKARRNLSRTLARKERKPRLEKKSRTFKGTQRKRISGGTENSKSGACVDWLDTTFSERRPGERSTRERFR